MKNVFVEMSKDRTQATLDAEKNLRKARENETVAKILAELKEMEYNGISGKEYEDKVLSLGRALNDIGMSISDLVPKCQCNICHDTGMVGDNVCQCVKERERENIVHGIGGKIDRTHTFSNAKYDIFEQSDNIKSMYEKLHQWIDGVDSSKYKSLLLVGGTGVGKTYLAECIANLLLDKGVPLRYVSAFSLSSMLLRAHTSNAEDKWTILDELATTPVLIVDDLGSEPKYKNVTEEYLTAILGERLTSGLVNVFTTNCSMDAIREKYGERVFSRLVNKDTTLCVFVENPDLRLSRHQ